MPVSNVSATTWPSSLHCILWDENSCCDTQQAKKFGQPSAATCIRPFINDTKSLPTLGTAAIAYSRTICQRAGRSCLDVLSPAAGTEHQGYDNRRQALVFRVRWLIHQKHLSPARQSTSCDSQEQPNRMLLHARRRASFKKGGNTFRLKTYGQTRCLV